MQQAEPAQCGAWNDSENAAASRWDQAMRANDFAAAWAINDAILGARDPARSDDPALPYHLRWVWDGRPLDGQRVLVRCYHGLGDTLQFARYLMPLRARAAHVTLEVQPELCGLLHGMADRVQAFHPARPLRAMDVNIEIMELAHALRLPPRPEPYLHAEPSAVRGVGLCWQAGGWDESRSIPMRFLGPLRGRKLVSLQRGAAATHAAGLGARDPLEGGMDIRAMAALIAGLEAVVTVDTMIAHLAGALGRPTIVLLPHRADWRWGSGARCAWYGAAYLVRQPGPGLWAPVVEAAATCLQGLQPPGWG